jgi:hypothetical protein
MSSAAAPLRLPPKGTARVKSVLSGDTVILLGRSTAPHLPPPEVLFTLEGILAPRYVCFVLDDDAAKALHLTFVIPVWKANPIRKMNQVLFQLANGCANK